VLEFAAMPLSLLAKVSPKLIGIRGIRVERMTDQRALDSGKARSGHWVLIHEPCFVALGLTERKSLRVGCPKTGARCRCKNVSGASN